MGLVIVFDTHHYNALKGYEMPFHSENADTFLLSALRTPNILIQARRCHGGNNEVGKFNQFRWLRFYRPSAAIIKTPLATNLIGRKPAIITNLFNVYWLLDLRARKLSGWKTHKL